jgi:histidinol dehydrogenase
MNIYTPQTLTQKRYAIVMKRSGGKASRIKKQVSDIIQNVRKNTDRALYEMVQKRYGAKSYSALLVSKKEIATAYTQVSQNEIRALQQMIQNITAVQGAQLPKKIDICVRPTPGILVTRVWRPISRVGLYIPGGKAVYPSSVCMTAIPAKIAGCSSIVLCTPPDKNGLVPAPTLVAADMLGITEIYKIGGAESIAAMAYGTETISPVYKIYGAGNSYVTEAKLQVQRDIAIDMPAGPSEVLIIADDTADPTYIAADLLADAEHGEDSAPVLVTTSLDIAKRTVGEIKRQLGYLPTAARAIESFRRYGLILVVSTINEAITFSNTYAPEHLEIMTKNPDTVVDSITDAGSVFVGPFTTKATGDYATGANHVLPTGGMAKMYPPLGVECYGKWMQVQTCTKRGLANIAETILTIARTEGLPGHANTVSVRGCKKRNTL